MVIAGTLLSSCTDSGVDPETAVYVGGEVKGTDTFNLQKAYIEAGIIGESGNVMIGDFVEFGHVTQYSVDTARDGTVLGLRDLHLKTTFGDEDDPSVRHTFYPLRELQFRIPVLEWTNTNGGTPVDLKQDPDIRGTTGGLKALFVHNGNSVTLVTTPDNDKNHAYITGIDTRQRTIGLFVKADLTNPLSRGTPNRVVDRLVVEIALQLPY